jgi:uncharacterized protein (DUF736 family)
MEYDNTNTGVLFKNETDNDKAPAYKGKINVNGSDFELAAWIKTGKSGQKFMSLKVQPPFQKQAKPEQTATPFDDSDIPF